MRIFSTTSRPASGRPAAALGRQRRSGRKRPALAWATLGFTQLSTRRDRYTRPPSGFTATPARLDEDVLSSVVKNRPGTFRFALSGHSLGVKEIGSPVQPWAGSPARPAGPGTPTGVAGRTADVRHSGRQQMIPSNEGGDDVATVTWGGQRVLWAWGQCVEVKE